MMLIGVDYHPSFQTIAFFMEETGECGEQEGFTRASVTSAITSELPTTRE
jgi:hypothetical protein